MTKRQRTLLFAAVLTIFIAVTPLVILYSQGYRFDWELKKITQTGAFYFKVAPSRTDIFVNGAFQKKTDFLFDSALVDNLAPKTYAVRIEKEGYIPWVKTLSIKPKEVTEAKYIALFPKTVDFQVLFQNVSEFWPSPDQKTLLLNKTSNGNKWVLAAWDAQTNQQKVLTAQKSNEQILGVAWSDDSSKILLQIAANEQMQNSVVDISSGAITLATGVESERISFSPSSNDELVFLNNSQALLVKNYILQGKPTAIAPNVVAFLVKNSNVIWLDAKGYAWQKNLSLRSSPELLTQNPYPLQKETTYAFFAAGDTLFLLAGERGTLLKINGQKQFEKVLGATTNLVLSPDKKKLAVVNGPELWITYLEEQNDQPHKKVGELSVLGKFDQTISSLVWMNNHEVILNSGNAIQAVEIDDRGAPNVAPIASYKNPMLFWDQENQTLAVVSEGNLSVSEKLVK